MTLREKAVKIAATKIGQKEKSGNNDGPFVEMLQRWMDGGDGWMKGEPWCATFACWCIMMAARELKLIPMMPRSASSSDIYEWTKEKGLLLPKPVPNCLGLMKGDGGTPGKTHHHTFFVEGLDGQFVRGIDGNWQNSVMRTRHAIADCDFAPIV